MPVTTDQTYAAELEVAVSAATEAGRAVQTLYERAAASTYTKADGSPVTDADLTADRMIRSILRDRFPQDAILTEEGVDETTRLASTRCWIVDPIDGTDQFVRRTDDFDVLVALVVDGRPVAAVGYQPPTGVLCGAARGRGAWVRFPGDASARPVRLAPVPTGAPPRLATSVWFGAPANLQGVDRTAQRVGTTALEVLTTGFSPRLFLDGRRCDALLGLREGPDQTTAWEWDFAVADLLINEAGGVVTDLWGRLHRYNKTHPCNEGGLVAAADPVTHARLLAAVRPELPA